MFSCLLVSFIQLNNQVRNQLTKEKEELRKKKERETIVQGNIRRLLGIKKGLERIKRSIKHLHFN